MFQFPFKRQGLFRPMSKEHVPTWIVSVYTVHVIMFPHSSASVYIVTILLNLGVVVSNSVFTVCNVYRVSTVIICITFADDTDFLYIGDDVSEM